MHSPHLIFALTADVQYNSRALKQLQALCELGFSIDVIFFTRLQTFLSLPPLPVRWHQLPIPSGRGPRFFYAIHRSLSNYLQQLPPADFYHASDLYVLPALAHHTRIHQAFLTYDARERYPYVFATRNRPWVQKFWFYLEKHFIQKAHAVFTVSEGLAKHLEADYAITSPVVLPNIPTYQSPPESTSCLRDHLAISPDEPVFLHQGVLKPGRNAHRLLQAMQQVPQGVLVFMGEGPELPHLKALTQKLKLSHKVHFIPPVLPEALLSWTASADVGITLLEDTCLNHRVALPNKLFEYLMAGLPVLASHLPEISQIVASFQVGLTVPPSDVQSIANALNQLSNPVVRHQLKQNIPAVLEQYRWEKYIPAFKDCFRQLASTKIKT